MRHASQSHQILHRPLSGLYEACRDLYRGNAVRGRYGDSPIRVSPFRRERIRAIGQLAVRLLVRIVPLRMPLKLVGRADTDLEKGHAFEQDISLKRASNVEAYLRAKIDD